MEIGRQRQTRRLDLQQTNYQRHTDCAKNFARNFLIVCNHAPNCEKNNDLDRCNTESSDTIQQNA